MQRQYATTVKATCDSKLELLEAKLEDLEYGTDDRIADASDKMRRSFQNTVKTVRSREHTWECDFWHYILS